jgi:broad specificity phosphatase PhoE
MRHGRTALDNEKRSDGWLDFPLSDEGRVGLIKAQQYLKAANIDCIYTPSLRRTYETAHIMASGILSHPDVEVADEARTWNLGMLMGTKKKPNRTVVQYYMDHPTEKPFGGESMQQFQDRFIPWLKHQLKESQNGSVLVVTSGSNLREIGREFTGDKDTYDLDEGGLLMLWPHKDTAMGHVVFGHKSKEDEYFS